MATVATASRPSIRWIATLSAIHAAIVIGVLATIGLAHFMAYGGVRATFFGGLFLCVTPGITAALVARLHRIPGEGRAMLLALPAVVVAAYAFVVTRFWIILDYEVVPWDPRTWPDLLRFVESYGVVIDRFSGEERPITRTGLAPLKISLILVPLGMLLLSPSAAAIAALWHPPFCKRCRNWIGEPFFEFEGASTLPDYKLTYRLSKNDLGVLDTLGPVTDPTRRHYRVKAFRCAHCDSTETLLGVWAVIEDGRPGVTATLESSVLKPRRVDPALVERLRQRIEQGSPAA